MRPNESGSPTGSGDPARQQLTIELPLPLPDTTLFRHGASEEILLFLAYNPDIRLSIRMLADAIDCSEKATRDAVNALEASGLVETERTENKRLVGIPRDRLHRPEDLILSIPQAQFQLPVRVALGRIRAEFDDVLGVVIFGSVARGEADRQSDIDLWVLVRGERSEHVHRANEIMNDLSDVRIPVRMSVMRRQNSDPETDLVSLLRGTDWPSGQRHSFEILVETPESALQKADEISDEIFAEGITLHGSETLDHLKQEILDR